MTETFHGPRDSRQRADGESLLDVASPSHLHLIQTAPPSDSGPLPHRRMVMLSWIALVGFRWLAVLSGG